MIKKMVRELLSSKKAVACVTGVVLAFAARIGLELAAASVAGIVGPIMADVLGQGLADFGKHSGGAAK